MESIKVWRLLTRLGAPEFGLITQAVLAISFKSLGASIEYVRQTDHPDIELDFNNRHYRIEVEFSHPGKSSFLVKDEDFQATKPLSQVDEGYIGVFDCNYPVHWILVKTGTLRAEGLGSHSLSSLDSICDGDISKLCTQETVKFLVDHSDEIEQKRFPGICREYLYND